MRKKAVLPCLLLIALCFWACTGTGDVRNGLADTDWDNNSNTEVTVYPQLGHTDIVNSVAFSPDGKQVLSGSSDNTLKLWDVATGREIRTFSGHTGIVNSVAFSPDGKQILSGSNDNTLKLWDASSGQELKTFQGHIDWVSSVAFSPNGRQVLSGSSDLTARLWDLRSGREIRTFQNLFVHGPLMSVEFSPNGRQILTGNFEANIAIWNASTGQVICGMPTGTHSQVTSLAFNPNGRQFLSSLVYSDNAITLRDVQTAQIIRTFSGHNAFVNSAVFNLDGKLVLSGSQDRTLKLWETATGQEIRTFHGHTDSVSSVAFSPDGKLVLSGSHDNTLKLWDAESGQLIRTFSGYIDSISSVAFSPDGGQILSGSPHNTIKLMDTKAGLETRTFQGHTNIINSVVYSPDQRQILSCSQDNTARLWDTESGQEIRIFEGHTGSVTSVAFSPDGRQVLSGSDDLSLKLWDAASGQEIRTFSGHTDFINSVAFSPDGRQVLSGANDWSLKLWDVRTEQESRTFLGHSGPVYSVAFSPDGRHVLSGASDNTIKLWDIATGQEIRTFKGHTNWINSVAFSPDGRHILSSARDSTIKLWDVESGREIRTFSGYNNLIYSVAFIPEGKIILYDSIDGTTRLWDIESGNEITQFISFTDGEWIAITPEGYYNASPNGDRYLNVRVGNNVYGIDQYRDTFYNPALVALAISDRDAYLAAVQQTIQDAAAPPSITIASLSPVATTASTSISVSVDGGSQSIQYLTVNVNGKTVARDIGVTPAGTRGLAPIARLAVLAAGDANKKQVSFNLDIPLDPGSNIIEVLAFNGFSEGRALVEVSYNTTQSNLPNLYILSIGVGRYADPSVPNLRFAPNDARGIVAAFKSQEGRRYGQVRSLVLADGGDREPTRDNISDGMDFLRSARQNDIILLFLSGHGGTDDLGQFFFMPGNMAFNQNGTPQRSRIIPNSDLQEVLRFPGQKLVFIDSCYSGGFTGNQAGTVDNDTLINSLKDDAPVIFTSSSKTQQSWEWESASLGLFTHVLIQGLSGTADTNRDGRITVEELGDYVKKTVPGMKDSQQPYYWSPPGYRDFVIAVTGR